MLAKIIAETLAIAEKIMMFNYNAETNTYEIYLDWYEDVPNVHNTLMMNGAERDDEDPELYHFEDADIVMLPFGGEWTFASEIEEECDICTDEEFYNSEDWEPWEPLPIEW